MAGIEYIKALCKRWKLVVLLLLLATLGLFAIACGTSVILPPAAPEDPVTTYLLMDDLHRGLWLPREEGGLVEYGYGDWDWYANNHDSWYHVFDTILWSTQGTLGRRFSSSESGDELRRQFYWMQLHEISVARKDMEALRRELADAYAEGVDRQVYNARYRMSFVPSQDGYWFGHNCNDAVADWLTKLGCEVSWVPIRIGLAVGTAR